MRRLLKTILFWILPIITLVTFIMIGKSQTYQEYMITANMHHGMSSDMYMGIWVSRGVYSMLLVIAVSFVIFSMISKIRKIFLILMLALLNIPLIYFMNILIPNPQFILIIPIVNVILIIPFYINLKSKIS